jgi:hypothetical protein
MEAYILFDDYFDAHKEEALKYPIYVPSKDRVAKSATIDHLQSEGIPYSIVVEPQDYDEYVDAYGKEHVLSMDKNDQGIVYVRNFCKTHSINEGHSRHWQIDDNIKSFRIRTGGKNVKSKMGYSLSLAEKFVDEFENIGIAGLTHQMFAFAKKHSLDINRQAYSCVLVDNNLDLWWRDSVEDTDYSLQVLASKKCTVVLNRLIIEKAATGEVKGGNEKVYSGDGRLRRTKLLQEYWPGWFQYTEKYGRIHVKPSRIWRTFEQTLIKKGEVSPLDMFL